MLHPHRWVKIFALHRLTISTGALPRATDDVMYYRDNIQICTKYATVYAYRACCVLLPPVIFFIKQCKTWKSFSGKLMLLCLLGIHSRISLSCLNVQSTKNARPGFWYGINMPACFPAMWVTTGCINNILFRSQRFFFLDISDFYILYNTCYITYCITQAVVNHKHIQTIKWTIT